jgi:SAM-dependent methyltransferase
MGRDRQTGWATFFNGHAPQYDDNCFTKNTVAEVDFLVDKLALTPGMAILDVGCGTGRHSIELARRGYNVTGIVMSAGMLAEAGRKAVEAGVEVTWLEADARAFSFPDRFDAAICLCEGAFGLLGSTDDPIAQPQSIIRNTAESMKAGAGCLFTVLNACAMIRKYSNESVRDGQFDPVGLAERSEFDVAEPAEMPFLRERAFVPTELVLMFGAAGIEVTNIWGGTAGNWGERPIDMDEIEIMVVGRKTAE